MSASSVAKPQPVFSNNEIKNLLNSQPFLGSRETDPNDPMLAATIKVSLKRKILTCTWCPTNTDEKKAPFFKAAFYEGQFCVTEIDPKSQDHPTSLKHLIQQACLIKLFADDFFKTESKLIVKATLLGNLVNNLTKLGFIEPTEEEKEVDVKAEVITYQTDDHWKMTLTQAGETTLREDLKDFLGPISNNQKAPSPEPATSASETPAPAPITPPPVLTPTTPAIAPASARSPLRPKRVAPPEFFKDNERVTKGVPKSFFSRAIDAISSSFKSACQATEEFFKSIWSFITKLFKSDKAS